MNGVEVFVPLTKGFVTCIDIEDWDAIRPFPWRAQRSGNGKTYAGRSCYLPEKHIPGRQGDGNVTVLMHDFLMGRRPGFDVDHKNGDAMDNRRDNLRFGTRSQNCANQKIRSTNKSGFKGVNFSKEHQKWVARISVNFRRIHLGYFSTAEKAALAYNTAAQKHFREFARLNVVTP